MTGLGTENDMGQGGVQEVGCGSLIWEVGWYGKSYKNQHMMWVQEVEETAASQEL